MSQQKTLKDTRNATSSPGSEVGFMHSNCPVGHQTDLFGLEVAHANPFRWLGLEKAMKTNGTYGQSSPDLFVSADLQQSLENRLRQRLAVNGSPEYDLIWKQWDIESGPRICALRASARRTSGRDCGGLDGWPKTPQASDGEGGVMEIRPGTTGKYKLRDYAATAGWPTASSRDHKDTPGMSETGANPDGSERKRLDQLPRVSQLTTPAQSGGPAEMGSGEGCRGGWQTPKSSDCKSPGKSRDVHLKHQAEAAGYPTPRTISGGGESAERKQELVRTTSGGGDIQAMAETFRMPDMTGWKLNPLFSLWLMGYPAEWAYCVVPEMQSTPR
jgi:hypothetical protein